MLLAYTITDDASLFCRPLKTYCLVVQCNSTRECTSKQGTFGHNTDPDHQLGPEEGLSNHTSPGYSRDDCRRSLEFSYVRLSAYQIGYKCALEIDNQIRAFSISTMVPHK